jgi:predicted porin
MKKTLVALAVLAAAGSVNAAEIYSNDGVTTSLSGVAEVQFYQSYYDVDSDGNDTSDMQVRMDDFDLTAATSVALSEDLAAVGAVSLGGLAQEAGAATIDRVYVGFASAEAGTLTVGRQTTITDDMNVDFAQEFDLHNSIGMDSGDDVVKYVYDNGQFFFGIASDLTEGTGDESVVDGRIGARAENLEVALYVNSTEGKETAYDLEAVYSADALTLSAAFGETSVDEGDEQDTIASINAKYTVDATSYAAGYGFSDDADDTSRVYLNVTQKLASSVAVYAEVGFEDAAESNTAYAAGMEVKF